MTISTLATALTAQVLSAPSSVPAREFVAENAPGRI